MFRCLHNADGAFYCNLTELYIHVRPVCWCCKFQLRSLSVARDSSAWQTSGWWNFDESHFVHVWHWFSPQLLPMYFCRHLRLGSLGWIAHQNCSSLSRLIGLGLVPDAPFCQTTSFPTVSSHLSRGAILLQFTVSAHFRKSPASGNRPRSRSVRPDSQPLGAVGN